LHDFKETQAVQDLLLFSKAIASAKKEISELGGRITHQLTQDAFVAHVPDAVTPSDFHHAAPTPDTDEKTTAWVVNAFEAFIDPVNPAPTASEGISWNAAGYQAPREAVDDSEIDAPPADEEPEADIQQSLSTPTHPYLIGSVAVGVVVVSGTQGSCVITQAEQTRILQEVIQGANFLANAEPRAQVTFVYDLQPITVSVPAGPDSSISGRYEKYERGWRDAALKQMGYVGGQNGYRAYVDDLRSQKNTRWSYVVFFTKYPLNHFAYAGRERVVMHYANDGWGPTHIHKVFAHETCHIFGAADEYGNCRCGGAHGYLGVPNNNCVNCPGTPVPCLMNRNELTVCRWTQKQIGWDDRLLP
jgi:hypothetical protein